MADQAKGREPAVTFTRQAAERIVRAVRTVERGDGSGGGSWYGYRSDDGEALKLAKTKEAWDKDSEAEVELYSGEPGSETAVEGDRGKVKAWNRFCDVAADKWVVIGLVDGEWHLVAPEPVETDVVFDVVLDATGLRFKRKTVWVVGKRETDPSDVSIPIEDCAAPAPDPAPDPPPDPPA